MGHSEYAYIYIQDETMMSSEQYNMYSLIWATVVVDIVTKIVSSHGI